MRGPARTALLLAAVLALLPCSCARRGRELFVREGCVNCHRFNGRGGGPGPDLTHVATRREPRVIRRQIADPTSLNPNSRMPAFPNLSWFDLRSLAAYLRS